MNTQLSELRSLASKAENRRTETGIPRVAMVQGAVPAHELAAVYDPMINLILQGSKTMTVGSSVLQYDPATYFVMSIGLPALGVVHPADTGEPYLAVSLTLDPVVIAGLLADVPVPSWSASHGSGFSVAKMTAELMDAWVRMLRLMKQPGDIPALAPVYEREILYRVLQGPSGQLLRDIATPDAAMARVNVAILRIRERFDQTLRVQELAGQAGMSESAFHRHFKIATALSPLQYQKQIRLLQARRLIVSGSTNVTSAAFAVGYASANQFSREYARFFGAAPSRDVAQILARMSRTSGQGA